MNSLPPDEFAYDAEKFVDRKELIDRVEQKVLALKRGEPVSKRTVVFLGVRGSGKTWLIQKLVERLRALDPPIVLCFALSDYTGDTSEEGVSKILRSASAQIAQARGATSDARGTPVDSGTLSRWLVEEAKQLPQNRPLVVLVDGIDEGSSEFLEVLETYFLAPLAREPRTLVVLAGRTRDPRPERGYTWRSPELRFHSEDYDLVPFDEKWTTEQLQKQRPHAVMAMSKIIEAGGGHPLSNFVLGGAVGGQPPDWTPDKAAALKQCAEVLLETVADEKTRSYFWALCVLRAIDEYRMADLLAVYFDRDVSSWGLLDRRRIRDEMLRPRLLKWAQDKGGYVMDDAVRIALENALREGQRELWAELHRAAHKLYTDWMNRYVKTRDHWHNEADYHAQRLQEAGCSL